MDQKTLKAYAEKAHQYHQDWLNQPEPSDMYELLQKFFIPLGQTADIGCGSGRDCIWLNKNDYPVIGFDSSKELLELATQNAPQILFQQAFFPTLKEINQTFDNILCETVIMHLPETEISQCIQSLKRILNKGGVLYLSWRVTEGQDLRHEDGRLYTAFEPSFITNQFRPTSILHLEDIKSASSGKRVYRLIAKAE